MNNVKCTMKQSMAMSYDDAALYATLALTRDRFAAPGFRFVIC